MLLSVPLDLHEGLARMIEAVSGTASSNREEGVLCA